MASQDSVLQMTASVVDGFSGPLKEMVKQLRTFGDYEKVVHKEGSKFAVQHRNHFEDLRKSMKGGAEQIKGVLTPAMVGLGVSAVGAAGAIEGISRAIKEFAGSSRDLTQLNQATGISINNIRMMDALAVRLGSSSGAMNAGLEKMSANFEQLHKFNRGELTQLFTMDQHGEGARFANSIKGMTDANQVLIASLNELDKIKSVAGKKRFLEIMGLDPQLAYETKAQLDDVKKSIGELSDDAIRKGLSAQEAFDRLRESVQLLKDEIGAQLAPVLTQMSDSVREFVSTHGEQLRQLFLDIGTALRDFDWKGFGQQIKDIVDYFGGWANALKLVVGVGLVAWLAPVALGFGALAIAITSAATAATAFSATALGTALLGGGAAAAGILAALGLPAAGAAAGLLASSTPLNAGEDERARQRKYGNLSSLGGGAGLNLKDQKDATKTGVFEGVIAAFQQWWNGPGTGDGAGGGHGPGGGGPGGGADTAPGHGRRSLMSRQGVAAHGALKANQAEAYKAAIAEGYSPAAAKAIVADVSGESLADPSNTNRSSHGQWAAGMVQWDQPRSDAIKAKFGKAPQDMTIPEQMKAMKWEIDTNPRFAKTKAALASGGTSESMVDALVRDYERPAAPDSDVAKRTGLLHGLGNIESGVAGAQAPPGGGYAGEPGLGQPGTAHGQKMVEVSDNFGHKFVTNEKYAAKFLPFLNKLQENGYKIHSLGGYEDRENANAAGKLSKHALGMAIDINADENPNQRDLKTDLPKDIAETAAKYGLVWGGKFRGMKDPMHFEIGGGMPSHTDAPWKGLDKAARDQSSMNHTINGRAGVDIKLAGFPKGTQIATRADGIFKEVKLVRGRPAGYSNRDVG